MTPDVTGLVLAGGSATRMGGVDKGLQLLHGKPMIAHVLERLGPQVSECFISANSGAYASLGKRVIADDWREAGPLSGMLAGLAASPTDWLVTAPCDAPFLPQDLVYRLMQVALRDDAQLVVARTADGRQPVFVLLHRSVANHLSAYIETGGRTAGGWYYGLRSAEAPFEDSQAFRNINTPDELKAAHGA